MKCGEFIEYNMRIIFVEKTCIKSGGATIRRPFSQIKIEYNSESIV